MSPSSVFCFKQKTAYEMRISDWSSDVCSSDLTLRDRGPRPDDRRQQPLGSSGAARQRRQGLCHRQDRQVLDAAGFRGLHPGAAARRSEEHTSELQSLMRISYAVYCLKKKTKQLHQHISYKNHTTDTNAHNTKIT